MTLPTAPTAVSVRIVVRRVGFTEVLQLPVPRYLKSSCELASGIAVLVRHIDDGMDASARELSDIRHGVRHDLVLRGEQAEPPLLLRDEDGYDAPRVRALRGHPATGLVEGLMG
ncbi:hypothetical protein [Mycolicibacterium sp. CBMA 361]|uniref:hypothetical protein n=1 Tax=Mycolicibacterium sp. CBMA 361 TaxID=2606610 RepID=UPI0013968455|nr:hypothetical protein [Mycolicibacterium sp. CBMA 361]